VESATTLPEESSRPVRRCAHDRNGMTTSDRHAIATPSRECSGACPDHNASPASHAR